MLLTLKCINIVINYYYAIIFISCGILTFSFDDYKRSIKCT